MDGQHSADGHARDRRLSRRGLLKGSALAVGGGIAGVPFVGSAAVAHEPAPTPEGPTPDAIDPCNPTGVDYIAGEGGGTVPLRAPAGLLDFLDPNEYLHNMEVIAFVPDVSIRGGEPLTTMWTKGKQRLLAAGGGFLDVTEPAAPFVVNTDAYDGSPNVVYNDRLGKWILLTSAQAPLTAPNQEFPRGKYCEEYARQSTESTVFRGVRTYDATDPSNVQLLQEFGTGQSGSGTHMNFYDGGRYAYLDCGFDDTLRMESSERPYSNALMIVDVSDPTNVREVSRWWVPGQRLGEEDEYFKYEFAGDQSSWTGNHGACVVPRRVEDGGAVGYGGWGRFGMYVHDLSDIRNPKVFSKLMHPLENMGGIPYHTIYPLLADRRHPHLRGLVIGVFEGLEADCREPWHTSYIIDVRDRRNPRFIGLFPRPTPPPGAPYPDFCMARGRFSAHNIQSWVAPGRMRPEIAALSYFSAGFRLYDISNPREPKETAYFVPRRDGDLSDFGSWRRGTTETVFIEWDRNLIWVGTHAGTYCMSSPALGRPVLEPREVCEWTVAHVNRGATEHHHGRGRRSARRWRY